MDKNRCFLICGGDQRQVELAKALSSDGYNVLCYGLDRAKESGNLANVDDLKDAAYKADFVILPLPCVVDEYYINMPLSNKTLKVDQLISSLKKGQIVIGGKISNDFAQKCKDNNIRIADYFGREEMVVLNVIPTVEGALQIAMEELPITIHSSKSLVLGYGRIGKMLSEALKNLGSHVGIEARSKEDLAWIKARAMNGIHLSD